ncbi:MAG: hypothetical protein NTV84_03270, partial [Methanoregula sp.]|nr:hypothetical protein [Methanoregula sp.]
TPKFFTKNLSGTRDNHPVRDFPKYRIAPFARIPASTADLIQPTLKTGTKKTALPSRPVKPSPSGRFPPLSKQHEIVRRVNALFRVRLRLSVVVAGRRCERLYMGGAQDHTFSGRTNGRDPFVCV